MCVTAVKGGGEGHFEGGCYELFSLTDNVTDLCVHVCLYTSTYVLPLA